MFGLTGLSEEERKAVKKDLTFEVEQYGTDQKVDHCFYAEDNGEVDGPLWVPRHYVRLKMPEQAWRMPDSPSLQQRASLRSLTVLQETEQRPQVSVFERTVSLLREVGGAVIVLPCGTGKTNIALAVAVELGLKTLILCHQVPLMDQWKERIEQFVGGNPRVGRLHRDHVETHNMDFVLGSIQSLLSRGNKYPPEAREYGLVIVDECHHIPAPTFWSVLSPLRFQCTLGLTATPDRKDNLQQAIYYLLGPVSFRFITPQRPDVQVNLVTFLGGDQKVVTYKNDRIGISKMITHLTEDLKRNKCILGLAHRMKKNGQRKGLILSDRVQHLRDLYSALGPEEAAIVCGQINTEKQEDDPFQKFLTLSTFQQFSEAVDFPGDFVILATPHSDVRQCTGRILRGKNKELQPVIIDILDPFSVFFYMANKRKRYYEKCGYQLCKLKIKVQ